MAVLSEYFDVLPVGISSKANQLNNKGIWIVYTCEFKPIAWL